MSERGFFSRILGGGAEDDETRGFSREALRVREKPERREPEEEPRGGITVERAAEVIDDLPPDVPRDSALRIVRGTLIAAGIKVEDLERSARARESKLNSEIDLARDRQEELRRRTDDDVRSLEEEIRRVREDRDAGITEEDERISRATDDLEGIKRVRAFFGFPEREVVETPEDTAGDEPVDETQVFEPFEDADETRVLRRGDVAFGGEDEPADTPSEGPSPYRDPPREPQRDPHRDPYGSIDER
jgi:hypothetical protein